MFAGVGGPLCERVCLPGQLRFGWHQHLPVPHNPGTSPVPPSAGPALYTGKAASTASFHFGNNSLPESSPLSMPTKKL